MHCRALHLNHFLARFARLRWATPVVLALTVGCSGGDDAVSVTETAVPAGSEATSESLEQQADAAVQGDNVISAEQAVSLAQQLLNRGRNAQAMQLLSVAIQAKPNLPEAYVLRARIFADAKLPTRAIADITSALKIRPDDAALLNARGFYALGQQKFGPALADFNAALKADPQNHVALNNRGLVKVAVGQNEEAIADFDASLEVKPDYVEALNNRGFARLQMGASDQALEDFNAAVAANPKFVNAWNNRGMAYLRTDDPAKAVSDFTEAIRMAPTNTAFFLRRAQAHEKAGDTEAAQKDVAEVVFLQRLTQLTQGIVQNPSQPGGYLERAEHLRKHGRLQPAAVDIARAIKVAPDAAEPWVAQATLFVEAGELDEAAKACTTAIAKEPLLAAYSIRGDIALQQGRLDDAIADYEDAQRLDSAVAEAYLQRSEREREAGNIKQASADMEQARLLDPSVIR